MNKCIICNKQIIGLPKVRLDETHECHFECWSNLLPQTLHAYSNKEEVEERRIKIEELAKKLITEYDAKLNDIYEDFLKDKVVDAEELVSSIKALSKNKNDRVKEFAEGIIDIIYSHAKPIQSSDK